VARWASRPGWFRGWFLQSSSCKNPPPRGAALEPFPDPDLLEPPSPPRYPAVPQVVKTPNLFTPFPALRSALFFHTSGFEGPGRPFFFNSLLTPLALFKLCFPGASLTSRPGRSGPPDSPSPLLCLLFMSPEFPTAGFCPLDPSPHGGLARFVAASLNFRHLLDSIPLHAGVTSFWLSEGSVVVLSGKGLVPRRIPLQVYELVPLFPSESSCGYAGPRFRTVSPFAFDNFYCGRSVLLTPRSPCVPASTLVFPA